MGIILGLAIYNGIILDVHFPLVVYKVGQWGCLLVLRPGGLPCAVSWVSPGPAMHEQDHKLFCADHCTLLMRCCYDVTVMA